MPLIECEQRSPQPNGGLGNQAIGKTDSVSQYAYGERANASFTIQCSRPTVLETVEQEPDAQHLALSPAPLK